MLHSIKPAKGARKNTKRIARGNSGSGGSTAGRGTKGQQARTGKGRRFGFEGGQTPLIRRQPKLGGFKNPNRIEYEVINIGVLEKELDPGEYDALYLRSNNLIQTKKPIKLLGDGELKKKFKITVNAASKSAINAVEKAGGKVVIQ